MSADCPVCGDDVPLEVTRGPLTVRLEPPDVYWRGIRREFTAAQCRLLYVLVYRGKASHLGLALALGEETSLNALAVHVSHMRKRIAAHGLPITLISKSGWGYLIEVGEK